MSNEYKFECEFCGKDFGAEVVELALHIGRMHDRSRGKASD